VEESIYLTDPAEPMKQASAIPAGIKGGKKARERDIFPGIMKKGKLRLGYFPYIYACVGALANQA